MPIPNQNKFWILICLFTFLCCSDNEQETSSGDENEEVNLVITNISPMVGSIGEEVVISWEGISQGIQDVSVSFNTTDSQIVSFSENQVIALIPDTAESGKILLKVNNYEALSANNFRIEGANSVSFEVSNFLPQTLRSGYEMTIEGNGFGSNIDDVSILFNDEDGQNIDAKILNVVDEEIRLAVPRNAISGQISLVIGSETLNETISIAPTAHRPIFYYQGARLRQMEFDPFENDIKYSNYHNSGTGIDEGYSLSFNPATNSFYGFTHFNINAGNYLRFYLFDDDSNSWTVKTICSSSSSACSVDISTITNTNNNKLYALEWTDINTSTSLTLKEIDEFGQTLNQHVYPNIVSGILAYRIFFASDINSFLLVSGSVLHKINASNFELESNMLSPDLPGLSTNSRADIFYDSSQNRLFLAKAEDIYEIDYEANSIEALNTDWKDYINNEYSSHSGEPFNFMYYEPTNDFFIQAAIGNYAATVFVVNMASGEASEPGVRGGGLTYGSNGRVFQWIGKD